MTKKIILWILVLSCMTTIFCLSAQKAEDSKKTSSGFIESVVRVLDTDNSLTEKEVSEITENMTNMVRTGAHFSIYALLGMLISLLVYEYGISGARLPAYTGGISFLYACSDELHQHFVDGRSAQLIDIAVDTAGAFCASVFIMIVILLVQRLKKRNKKRGE